ncbi:MAG: hypothetical protein ACD_11C00006G0011 [uncultured bacterium]|nr:MAG: hypothetical protein ACD_11C00006G0011 [uncultured bacterium]HBR71689.1 hypothetical protein [Candidatus Moranbacteria bacterium]
MRNDISKTTNILNHLKTLPYFTLDDILVIEKKQYLLRILLSRFSKSGKIIRLKKGIYVTADYLADIKRRNLYSNYSEFVAGIIYEPSYLSMDYILYEKNILTEIPKNIISVSVKKTQLLTNDFGNFYYHSIKPELFCGYEIVIENKLSFKKATAAKALFDFLYLRKNILSFEDSIKELRLNLDELTVGDIKELGKYIKLEDSKKMSVIYNILIKLWKASKKN